MNSKSYFAKRRTPLKGYTKTFFALSLFIFVIVATAIGGLSRINQSPTISPARSEDEATAIQEGVMPPKQKQHSKMFKGYKSVTGGKKLRDLSAETGYVEAIYDLGELPIIRTFDRGKVLGKLGCQADAVVIATFRSKSSQLVEDGTFTFTDYQLNVEEILKNNPTASVQLNSDITVTRPGGVVLLNGRTIRAIDLRRGLLLPKERYLLFLKYLPETNSYRSFSDSLIEDSFRLRGDKVVQLTRKRLPLGEDAALDSATFLAELRNALASPCD